MPKVSVVIPTYNSAKYIVSTVESVLAQTYTDFEIIVVDDGSTDETQQLLSSYGPQINYIYQENKKYSGARNTGIRAASGKYIAFLDSDDLWEPEKLEHQVAVMDNHPAVTLSHCQAVYMDPVGNPVKFQGASVRGDDKPQVEIADKTRELFFGAIVTTSTVMVRHSTIKEVGPFDDEHIHGEDWELWVRLGSKGPFAYIPKPLVKYRVFGWQKVLRAESSAHWVSDQFRTIERASALWRGLPEELERLRSLGAATIYIRAALAAYQMDKPDDGRTYLAQAIAASPEYGQKERIVSLAVDRAKLIELETGSYDQAERFIKSYFSNLPEAVSHFKGAASEATGWLYIGGAFHHYQQGDLAQTRQLLWHGVRCSPACLKNRGVVSMALNAWLGPGLANVLRKPGKIFSGSEQGPSG